ncbi:hypothetical protein H4219_004747 [Mycoemilia scoparia]|uniref:Uncharacterized protein n=1 Tax=Mycoemilia scoparia TaxID=417184 RepID=A0A9W8A056_9FUNG|nr:hypothetical protein H4219_004747 [Mycoemilia scoparia]
MYGNDLYAKLTDVKNKLMEGEYVDRRIALDGLFFQLHDSRVRPKFKELIARSERFNLSVFQMFETKETQLENDRICHILRLVQSKLKHFKREVTVAPSLFMSPAALKPSTSNIGAKKPASAESSLRHNTKAAALFDDIASASPGRFIRRRKRLRGSQPKYTYKLQRFGSTSSTNELSFDDDNSDESYKPNSSPSHSDSEDTANEPSSWLRTPHNKQNAKNKAIMAEIQSPIRREARSLCDTLKDAMAKLWAPASPNGVLCPRSSHSSLLTKPKQKVYTQKGNRCLPLKVLAAFKVGELLATDEEMSEVDNLIDFFNSIPADLRRFVLLQQIIFKCIYELPTRDCFKGVLAALETPALSPPFYQISWVTRATLFTNTSENLILSPHHLMCYYSRAIQAGTEIQFIDALYQRTLMSMLDPKKSSVYTPFATRLLTMYLPISDVFGDTFGVSNNSCQKYHISQYARWVARLNSPVCSTIMLSLALECTVDKLMQRVTGKSNCQPSDHVKSITDARPSRMFGDPTPPSDTDTPIFPSPQQSSRNGGDADESWDVDNLISVIEVLGDLFFSVLGYTSTHNFVSKLFHTKYVQNCIDSITRSLGSLEKLSEISNLKLQCSDSSGDSMQLTKTLTKLIDALKRTLYVLPALLLSIICRSPRSEDNTNTLYQQQAIKLTRILKTHLPNEPADSVKQCTSKSLLESSSGLLAWFNIAQLYHALGSTEIASALLLFAWQNYTSICSRAEMLLHYREAWSKKNKLYIVEPLAVPGIKNRATVKPINCFGTAAASGDELNSSDDHLLQPNLFDNQRTEKYSEIDTGIFSAKLVAYVEVLDKIAEKDAMSTPRSNKSVTNRVKNQTAFRDELSGSPTTPNMPLNGRHSLGKPAGLSGKGKNPNSLFYSFEMLDYEIDSSDELSVIPSPINCRLNPVIPPPPPPKFSIANNKNKKTSKFGCTKNPPLSKHKRIGSAEDATKWVRYFTSMPNNQDLSVYHYIKSISSLVKIKNPIKPENFTLRISPPNKSDTLWIPDSPLVDIVGTPCPSNSRLSLGLSKKSTSPTQKQTPSCKSTLSPINKESGKKPMRAMIPEIVIPVKSIKGVKTPQCGKNKKMTNKSTKLLYSSSLTPSKYPASESSSEYDEIDGQENIDDQISTKKRRLSENIPKQQGRKRGSSSKLYPRKKQTRSSSSDNTIEKRVLKTVARSSPVTTSTLVYGRKRSTKSTIYCTPSSKNKPRLNPSSNKCLSSIALPSTITQLPHIVSDDSLDCMSSSDIDEISLNYDSPSTSAIVTRGSVTPATTTIIDSRNSSGSGGIKKQNVNPRRSSYTFGIKSKGRCRKSLPLFSSSSSSSSLSSLFVQNTMTRKSPKIDYNDIPFDDL